MGVDLPRTPTLRLDGRRALVTGAGRGLGVACAAALGQAGASVTLVSRSLAEVEAVAEAMRRDGGEADAVALDILDAEAVRAMLAAREPYDVLVNNAGTNRPAPFLDVDIADFDAVMALNVRATFVTAQAVARHLRDRGRRGSIINVSSQMGHVGGAKRTVYMLQ